MVEVGSGWKTRADAPRLAGCRVVIEHDHHRDVIGGGAHGGGAIGIPVIPPLVGEIIVVTPKPRLITAGEITVDFCQVRNPGIAPLTEKSRIGVTRKCSPGFAKNIGVIIAIRVDQPQPFPRVIHRMLELPLRRVVVVVARRMHDTQRRAEPAAARRIESVKRRTGVAEHAVQLGSKVIVHEPHPRIPVAVVGRGRAQVFTKNHRVVARQLRVKNGIAQVCIGKPSRDVKLQLGSSHKARRAGILPRPTLLPEKIIRHMLHRVEAEPVSLRAVDEPSDVPDEIRSDILFESVGIRRHVGGSDISKTDVGPAAVGAVILGVIGVPDKRIFCMRGPLGCPEIRIRRLLRDVDQVSESKVLDLPLRPPIARVVPFAIESVGCHPEMKILGHHAGINVDRRVLIITRNIKRPVVHDSVEIHADPEPVRDFDQLEQLRLRPVSRPHRTPLILASQVKWIPQIISHRQPSAAFCRRRKPHRRVTGLRELRHLPRDLRPARIKKLEKRLRMHMPATEHQKQKTCSSPEGCTSFGHGFRGKGRKSKWPDS